MDNEVKQLIFVQSKLINECIRSIIYARHHQQLQQSNKTKFIQGCLIKTGIIQWCQLFGNNKEQVHWKSLKDLYKDLDFDRCKILKETGFTSCQWQRYYDSMVSIRNKFFAHFDMDSLVTTIPDLEPALQILTCYRSTLRNALIRNRIYHIQLTNDELMTHIHTELSNA